MDASMDERTGRNHHETGQQLTMPDRLNSEWSDMDVTVHIPDDVVEHLGAGGDLSLRALEALALEEYRSGHIGKADLRRLLGFTTRYELDGEEPAAAGILTRAGHRRAHSSASS